MENQPEMLARALAKTLNISVNVIVNALQRSGIDVQKSYNLVLTSEQVSLIKDLYGRKGRYNIAEEKKDKKNRRKVDELDLYNYQSEEEDDEEDYENILVPKKVTDVDKVEVVVEEDNAPHINIQNVVLGIQRHAEGLIVGIQNGLLMEKKEIEDGAKKDSTHATVMRIIAECIKLGGSRLDLSNLGLHEIPEEVFTLKNLRILDIRRNNIEHLKNLPPQLYSLFASNNQITKIENIPSQLKELLLWRNKIEKIENLPDGLRLLQVSDNNITSIDFLPKKLIKLYLDNNKIKSISIGGAIDKLSICNNEIASIYQIEGWEQLNSLFISGNPIQDLPEHIFNQNEEFDCINGIKTWMKELERKSEKNTYVKLILLGNSNVGKSSIVRALKKLPFDKDITSTHGINIETLNIKDADQPVDLQIWDLGGQEIYYGTHRMFMMSQSVQLIAFDANTEAISVSPDRLRESETVRNIKLPFYINRVQELSPNSKIVIVQNKIEENDATPDYLTEYLFDNKFEKVSAADNRGMRTLYAKIHDAATELNIYGQLVPYYWERVRKYFSSNLKKAEDARTRIIDKAQFVRICLKEKVLPEGIDQLLEHLHNIGAVYYRKELGENIILDQVWALKAIYKIFDRDSKFYFEMRNVYYGKCALRTLFDDFDKTENNYSIEDKWNFLKYMESCGLCFSIKHDEKEEDTLDTFFVFPEFLPAVKPNFVRLWKLKQSRRLVLRKRFKFLPYYPLHKFISRFGNKTMHNYLWRNGILICLDNDVFNGFLVEADFENHSIQITMDESVQEWKDAIISQLQIGKEMVGEEWEIILDQTQAEVTQKPAAELLEIKNVVQDSAYEGLNLPAKRRVVISYAKEDRVEMELLVKYLDAYKIDHWYDGFLTNRDDWDAEISHEFENADGYIVLMSADYMNSRKKYIHEKEVPLIVRRMLEQKKYCTILTVKSFSLNDAIHGDICKIPPFKKGAVLPAISDNGLSNAFMDEFICKEVLKKL